MPDFGQRIVTTRVRIQHWRTGLPSQRLASQLYGDGVFGGHVVSTNVQLVATQFTGGPPDPQTKFIHRRFRQPHPATTQGGPHGGPHQPHVGVVLDVSGDRDPSVPTRRGLRNGGFQRLAVQKRQHTLVHHVAPAVVILKGSPRDQQRPQHRDPKGGVVQAVFGDVVEDDVGLVLHTEVGGRDTFRVVPIGRGTLHGVVADGKTVARRPGVGAAAVVVSRHYVQHHVEIRVFVVFVGGGGGGGGRFGFGPSTRDDSYLAR
jgi:hypothetical protein